VVPPHAGRICSFQHSSQWTVCAHHVCARWLGARTALKLLEPGTSIIQGPSPITGELVFHDTGGLHALSTVRLFLPSYQRKLNIHSGDPERRFGFFSGCGLYREKPSAGIIMLWPRAIAGLTGRRIKRTRVVSHFCHMITTLSAGRYDRFLLSFKPTSVGYSASQDRNFYPLRSRLGVWMPQVPNAEPCDRIEVLRRLDGLI